MVWLPKVGCYRLKLVNIVVLVSGGWCRGGGVVGVSW